MPEKILIVDDDVDSLKLIGLMLQRHGYEVIYANAGNQALAKANSDIPDLVILDVMMPDISGYEVCRRLRGNPLTQSIPIIMFTAKTLIDDKVAGFEAGADDYLTKPTHPAELASRVKTILQRNASQRTKESDQGTTIGIIGTKGGIGTTTLALNIGAAFKLMDQNPIVADFRPGAGSLGLFMGQSRSNGMTNVLSKPASEINSTLLEQELFTHTSGLRSLLSSTRPREALANYSIESALEVVRGLRTIGKPVVFDLGSGYSPLINRLNTEMDKLVVLIDPTRVTLTMARELLHELGKEDKDKTRINIVVVNRNQNSLQPPWNEVEQKLEYEIRAIISAAPELAFQATEAGVPIVNYQPNAIVASQISKLTEDISATIRTLSDGS